MCNTMTSGKISFGVRIDSELVDKINEIVEESKYLNASRSEVVEAILAAFFRSDVKHEEKVRELIIIRRKKRL